MVHDPKKLQAILEAAAPVGVPLSFRAMFGGIMGYADGRVFASLSDVGLALKMSGADHADFAAVRGCVALRYAGDQPASQSYLVVPDLMLEDRVLLGEWVRRCIAHLEGKK